MVGVPKVKRDKFSVFNFLSVTESREAAGELRHYRMGKGWGKEENRLRCLHGPVGSQVQYQPAEHRRDQTLQSVCVRQILFLTVTLQQ